MKTEKLTQLIKKGTEEQLAGNFTKAEETYRKILKEKDGPVIHNNLGFLFLQMKNYPEAIAEFKKAIQQKPDYATAYKHLGYAYFLSGESQLAIEATKECFGIDPTNADVAETLAKFYFVNNQWNLTAYYRKCAYELSGKTENLTEMAYALMMENNYQEAINTLQYVLSIPDSNSSRTLSLLGTAYMMTHNIGLAISTYKKALGLEPENIEARNNMALCLLQTGSTSEAMLEFKRVIMLDYEHLDARNNLAVLELATGQNESALQHFDVILNHQPYNAKALYYKSGILFQQEKFDESKDLLEKLISTPDENYKSKANEMLSNIKDLKN